MGTRGAMGFRWSDKEHIFYNGHDSYPEGLGAQLVKYVRDRVAVVGLDSLIVELKQRVGSLVAIDEQIAPTKEQKERCLALGIVNL